MRYLLIPATALVLSLVGARPASADAPSHHGRGHNLNWHFRAFGHQPKVTAAPELDNGALPAAFTLLAGTTILVLNRRRSEKTRLPRT
jgi:hypothetical protein